MTSMIIAYAPIIVFEGPRYTQTYAKLKVRDAARAHIPAIGMYYIENCF